MNNIEAEQALAGVGSDALSGCGCEGLEGFDFGKFIGTIAPLLNFIPVAGPILSIAASAAGAALANPVPMIAPAPAPPAPQAAATAPKDNTALWLLGGAVALFALSRRR